MNWPRCRRWQTSRHNRRIDKDALILDRAAHGDDGHDAQGVTRHRQVLAEASVVRDVKVGRERLWQLDSAQIEEAKRTLEMIWQQ
jgi:hypothetical protein